MRTLPFLLLLPSLLLLSACRDRDNAAGVFSSDPLLGCFATHPRKPAEFRIEQQQGQYFVSFNRDEQWQRDTTPLQLSSRADIARFFNDDADQIDKALVRPTGGFGIFHFNPGATLKGKDKDSDYMALVLIGAGPVFQVTCP
ncbi:hypothetical protein J7J08_10420 [Stenotrophomonas sp. ISL-67]|uniref:hypothetical protein n=1 Tax=Stenotrophomonas sp. ISL-67 TaxID=2819171 RepID=UPI001BE775DB|nr:hypothetical protein [Stenotrophomonas sp. ISL-67]MBT2768049.1 hypothetical protein [Stenotrophomonas sp. ISL-67]